MTRAAIYVRISRDATGEGAGVARQEQDCREKAAALGWAVAQVYADNDISAYTGKRRPAYEALLEAISTSAVDAVIVWHTDRLYRRTSELEQYIDVCRSREVPAQTVKAGPLDLSTPSGRMVARTLGSVAVYESEQKSERQKRANRQRAEQGRHFGTRRPFGYELDGVTVREVEAQAIRDAFELVLNGGALREVARRWNEAGLLTPQSGNPWTGTVVGRTLRTARLAGVKEYLKQVVRGEDGDPIRAAWPAIIDLDTWTAAQAVLNDPNRLKFNPTYASQMLLSGVAECADCGAPIQSGGTRKGVRRYRCSQMGGHVYRAAPVVDRYVEDVVLRRLAEPDLLEMIRADGPAVDVTSLRQEASAIHSRMGQMAEAFADGLVTMAQLKASNERAEARLAEIEAKMPKTGPAALTKLVTGLDLLRTWEALSLDAKRNVIRTLMRVRLVAPGTKENAYRYVFGIQQVNPETVLIEWR